MAFKEAPLPSSTITPPPALFQILANSSRAFSANPSSRHPEPQFLPMKTARVCSADEDIVRLCLRVNVRNATGRRVAGGSRIGSMEVFVGGAWPLGRRNGRAGVANAGEDEGIGSSAPAPILKRSGCLGVDVGSILLSGSRSRERWYCDRVKCTRYRCSNWLPMAYQVEILVQKDSWDIIRVVGGFADHK